MPDGASKSPSGPQPERFEPHVFDRYYLLEQVAFGGMAQIYRAKILGASGFERELVVKRVLSTLVSNPDFLQMLTNEAKLTAMLSHGNIAQVYELGLYRGVYYMTMEFVEGISLFDLIKDTRKSKPLTANEACCLVIELLKGLDYAHRKTDWTGKPLGIVHCDVSPGNIQVSFDGQVKVLDFGIARAAASFSNYKEGMVMGKFNYVAPEQAMGGVLDARTDLFAVGIVLYELLTGEHPFGRKGDVDTLVRIARLEKGDVTPPTKHNPTIPPVLENIVMKALAHQRGERWPSARHMEVELLRFIQPETPTIVAARLVQRIQELYKDRIAARRAARAHDDETVGRLQREHASPSGPMKSLGAAPPVTPDAAPVSPPGRAGATAGIAAAVGLVLGGAGFGMGKWVGGRVPGTAVVVCDAPGCKVSVNRELRGPAPLLLSDLHPGSPYLVEVTAEGRKAFTATFQAESARTVVVEAKLEAAPRGK